MTLTQLYVSFIVFNIHNKIRNSQYSIFLPEFVIVGLGANIVHYMAELVKEGEHLVVR